MVIKEQFGKPPAGQYDGWTDAQLHQYFFDNYDWTIMIRDRKGSADGWYWAETWKGMQPDGYAAPFAVFNAGFGLYCVRCHASATSELTFATEANMKGRPGEPLKFRDDLSWFFTGPLQPPLPANQPTTGRGDGNHAPHVTQTNMPKLSVPHHAVSKDWQQFSGTTVTPAPGPPVRIRDGVVVSPPNKPQHFITSDQCIGCHSGNRYGNVMLLSDTRVDSKPLANISPYGEWRWSPMGLAGRDPLFYAQLDSEIAFLAKQRPDQQKDIVNLCFSCHGGMGQRQLTLDSNGKEAFTPGIVKITDKQDAKFEYGSLAREGISCALCHHQRARSTKQSCSSFTRTRPGGFSTRRPPRSKGRSRSR
jgi:cytochrome c553